ncbi:BZ3500_MvSof-1268-A1-R1_Chr7-3g09688 [Microbotryum saponariae]|uniref:BZ3500_MvSof-1268-A1-R1_Chr7-3g09688 protein n=1 Tax=Microbotryum saponariae TaxID=289078 RepID=A0A2X0LCE6_9BASI|nr:BZ3501_MvSof-1269-A2-R1_Chr7-2g09411 [Microbotryum saponariae]SDA02418.1 BZ3500_MvSof-1268-A1-R1_Chr7-3g09688 [Microbotryum saponariae]
MKYSLVFVALVATATANVSALPADATKPTSASEVENPYFPKEHGVTVSQGPRITDSNPYESLVNCNNDKCTGCKGSARGTCIEQCELWMSSPNSLPEPDGC